MTTEIDVNEWLAALREAGANQGDDDPSVFTTRELAKAFSVSSATALVWIHKAYDAGMIETTKKSFSGLHGRSSPVTAYRLKLKPAKKGKR